ncbi:MAG: integrase, partial [Gemmatimonadaceae bacterium]|nr:integrase [Caulobacter sp.]
MAQRDLFLSPKQTWNHRRLFGPKPPFKPKHVWGIRQQLKATGRVRDLALFNCAIDAKLRGCDLVKL